MLRYLTASCVGMSFLAYNTKNVSYSRYNLSGRRVIDDITQLDLVSPVQLLQEDAIDEIKAQKLVVGSSVQISKWNGVRMELYTHAPYGIYFKGQYFKQYKIGSFYINTHPNEEPTIKKLPSYLSSVQTYMDAVVVEAENTMDGVFISKEYLEPLVDSIKEWETQELQTGNFGHINKNLLQVDDLDPDLKKMLPYFTNVLQIIYKILRESNGCGLQEIYEYGPNSTELFIAESDVIGFNPTLGIIYTSWGIFSNVGYGKTILPKNFSPKNFRRSELGFLGKSFIVMGEGDLVVNKHRSQSEQHKITESWIAIRDIIFNQLQQDIKNGII